MYAERKEAFLVAESPNISNVLRINIQNSEFFSVRIIMIKNRIVRGER